MPDLTPDEIRAARKWATDHLNLPSVRIEAVNAAARIILANTEDPTPPIVLDAVAALRGAAAQINDAYEDTFVGEAELLALVETLRDSKLLADADKAHNEIATLRETVRLRDSDVRIREDALDKLREESLTLADALDSIRDRLHRTEERLDDRDKYIDDLRGERDTLRDRVANLADTLTYLRKGDH